MPQKKTTMSKDCRDAVNRLHEVMKLCAIVELELKHKESDFKSAISIFVLFVGLAAADYVAAATVVYSIGPVAGITAENVFLDPVGGVFMDFTWFGLGLIIFSICSILALLFMAVYASYRRTARKKVIEMNEKLKDAKSVILEVCPMELWYSGDA